jgi:predicted dehydrogenase
MRVIQVGLGGMGDVWLRTVLAAPNVEFAGFVEISAEMAGQQAAKYDLDPKLIFGSLDEALRKTDATTDVTGVLNVTPPQFHQAVSVGALEAGLPVLSEKPLADTLAAAQAIVETAERTGVLHMVAQNYRYRSPTQTLRQALVQGGCGEIGAVQVEFYRGPHFGGFREKMAYPLIIDMSIHHFDLMRFFLARNPLALSGRSWNPAWSWFEGDASAAVWLAFQDGIEVTYTGSWCSQGKPTSWNGNWRFDCANGVVSMVDDVVTVERLGEAPEQWPAVLMELEGQAYLLQEFARAVQGGAPPATSCQDNLYSLAIVFDVVESFRTGQPVVRPVPV